MNFPKNIRSGTKFSTQPERQGGAQGAVNRALTSYDYVASRGFVHSLFDISSNRIVVPSIRAFVHTLFADSTSCVAMAWRRL